MLVYYCVPRPRETRWAGTQNILERSEIHTKFWSGNLKRTYDFEEPGVVGRILNLTLRI
jgi:hypothetical protein